MSAYQDNGGSSIGAALGKVAAKVAKKTTSGSGNKVGRSAAKINRNSGGSSRRSSSGGSSRSSYSGSSGGGGYSGGSGGGGYSAPKPPSLAAYLKTDSAYQGSIRGGKRSLADFLGDIGRRRGEAGTQFTQTTASMERDRVQQLADLRDEFASRGLIQSGLYGQEEGNFQKKFTEQSTALQQQQAALLADLLSQEKNYRRENDNASEAAKQDALQRRAAKYGI